MFLLAVDPFPAGPGPSVSGLFGRERMIDSQLHAWVYSCAYGADMTAADEPDFPRRSFVTPGVVPPPI
jgi:nitrite reductase/ring-hydroxylating ferredoxin subunit